MISDKAVHVTRMMNSLAQEEFGDAYTLKSTFWNDGDFRVVAYSAKNIDKSEVPKHYKKLFIDLRYQDSKLNDGEVIKVVCAQGSSGSRIGDALVDVGDREVLDLPVPE